MRMTRTRWALVASAVALVACVALGSSVVAGQFRVEDPSALEADFTTGELTRVGDMSAVDGLPARGVFVQVTRGGKLCLWDAPSADSPERQGGCNPVSDPLGGSAVSASLAYEGGPALRGVKDARLVGLAAREVAAARVEMSDGSSRELRLGKVNLGSLELQSFGYRFKRVDLRNGAGPTAVVVTDAAGKELARQPTGIGG
jgi:hypothetical protein